MSKMRWEGKRGSGKCALRQLSPVQQPEVGGVENVRRQVVARVTLTRAVATPRRT